MSANADVSRQAEDACKIDFLWLELTNQCNLQCSHCYAESGPQTGATDRLSHADYERTMDEAAALGCRTVQFIGGEPTLNRGLIPLIEHASAAGFTSIEVFTNLTRLSDQLLSTLIHRKARVATSVYADTADLHDRITTISGSFVRTIANLKKLLAAGIPVRVGVIAMDANHHAVDQTVAFLRSIGVQNVGTDGLRKIGRGGDANAADMTQLCGECAGNTVCVAPDGGVSPCIMSKPWTVGSVRDDTLGNIVGSTRMRSIRDEIYAHTGGRHGDDEMQGATDICAPKTCAPYGACSPKWGPGPCAPSGCNPCYPKG
ncbi:MAG: radical SAM protein [Rhodospirillaceae bacterium]|nr:radical SAM protein [Rhodospirillaceae bacterium]